MIVSMHISSGCRFVDLFSFFAHLGFARSFEFSSFVSHLCLDLDTKMRFCDCFLTKVTAFLLILKICDHFFVDKTQKNL